MMLLKNEIWRALCALLCSSLLGVGCLSPLVPFAPIAAQDDVLQLNQIQILASHNSYRLHTNDTVFATLQDLYAQGLLPDNLSPHGLDYTHLSFPDQMNDYPIRGLEIDIYNDPQGGAFANRKMNELVGLPVASGVAALNAPGFKVLHIKDVDYNTHYYTFAQALQAVKTWSDAHPNHIPLFINIESKQDSPADNAALAGLGFTPPPPYTAAAADSLDATIRAVFGESLDKILTPDRVRGNLATLNEVVTLQKWPKLGEARGKIVFIMEGKAVPYYKSGHASLKGRAMFVYATAGAPEAAFLLLNKAVTDEATIVQRVKEGYIVRTRADADTEEARTGNYATLAAALRSGAQIVSTDYYRPDPRGGIDTAWSTYYAKFPNGELARKNPVNALQIGGAYALKE